MQLSSPRKILKKFNVLKMINRIIKLGISILYYCFYKIISSVFGLAGKKPPATFEVLYYHEIYSEHKELFARQVKDIIRITEPVGSGFKGQLSNGKHYVAVTFDDGFQCLLDNAFPELVQHKIPFTVFMPSAYIGKHPGWITDTNNPNHNETVMTSEQINSLPKNLVTIGSHCVTHPNLNLLKQSDAVKELVDSRKQLNEIIDTEVTLLAFPYGEYSKNIVEWSKKAGYVRVFSGLPDPPFSEKFGFLAGRISVTPYDWPIEFRLKLRGAYQWLPLAVTVKGTMRKMLRTFNGK